MDNLKALIGKLTDKGSPICKIVTILPSPNNNAVANYTEANGTIVVNCKPIDDTADIKGVRLSTTNNNISVPAIGAYGVVLFTDDKNAFLLQSSAYVSILRRVENVDGTSTTVELKIENNQSVLDIDSENIAIETTGGGKFALLGNNLIITDVANIKFQITSEEGILAEIELDKDRGITIASYGGRKIDIKNELTSIKDILFTLLDKFATANYVGTGASAVVDPLSIIELNELKPRIEALFK